MEKGTHPEKYVAAQYLFIFVEHFTEENSFSFDLYSWAGLFEAHYILLHCWARQQKNSEQPFPQSLMEKAFYELAVADKPRPCGQWSVLIPWDAELPKYNQMPHYFPQLRTVPGKTWWSTFPYFSFWVRTPLSSFQWGETENVNVFFTYKPNFPKKYACMQIKTFPRTILQSTVRYVVLRLWP